MRQGTPGTSCNCPGHNGWLAHRGRIGSPIHPHRRHGSGSQQEWTPLGQAWTGNEVRKDALPFLLVLRSTDPVESVDPEARVFRMARVPGLRAPAE